MNLLKLALLIAAIPLGIVGSIRLFVRALRYYRRNRAEAGVFSLSLLRDHFAEGVEEWADAPSVITDGFGDGDSTHGPSGFADHSISGDHSHGGDGDSH